MRLEQRDGEETARPVGAAVVRSVGGGDVVLELGPADGPAVMRLRMSYTEAMRLAAAVQAVAHGGGESVLIVDD